MVATPPQKYEEGVQRRVYETLLALDIPFMRVDTDDGSTMEDCQHIGKALDCPVVKTILLCNRQQTQFYLYVTSGDKPFVTRDFCSALGISRVSFAPEALLWQLLGTRVGATTVLSLVADTRQAVAVVIDSEVAQRPMVACTDGTRNSFMKLSVHHLIERYIPHTGHTLLTI